MPTARISIGCPPGFRDRVTQMVHDHPPLDFNGQKPVVRDAERRGDALEFDLAYPDPRPTIPELIAKWHADPTAENRKALREALKDLGSAYTCDGTSYYASSRLGVPLVEVY